ncbi:MAG: hypothetical protein WKG07_38695 [Hymenobacter sp.]
MTLLRSPAWARRRYCSSLPGFGAKLVDPRPPAGAGGRYHPQKAAGRRGAERRQERRRELR